MDAASEARFERALQDSMRNSGNTDYSSLSSSYNQTAKMKACKIAVLNKSKFEGLPMAAVSVRSGKNSKHINFSVRWEGTTGHGDCKVSDNGHVKHVNIKKYHKGKKKHHHHGKHHHHKDSSSVPHDIDGFYYDRHLGQWRDPSGKVCHSCTPENGFPDRQHSW